MMQEDDKCTACGQPSKWYYPKDGHYYCNAHLPCGRFMRMMGHVITVVYHVAKVVHGI